jgi:phosphatidylserine/phosphatidylglycerophosphate/cardiolipin synthase-like enzyme
VSERASILRAVGEFAWRVSPEVVTRIADELRKLAVLGPQEVTRVATIAHAPDVRRHTADLLERWTAEAGGNPAELGALLHGAAATVLARGLMESAHLVWTGPASARVPFRRTDEALLEVVRAATRVLTLVTFAAYRVPDVRVALEVALDHGVEVRFFGETEKASDGHLSFDAALALGQRIASRARLFEWPREMRVADARGLIGRLHAKCALADDALFLVSSANLTEAAFEANMEMGVLLKGGPLPAMAARHFEDLITSGTLRVMR